MILYSCFIGLILLRKVLLKNESYFHASKLPRFSGGSPIQNQIIRGINKTYLTCYLMNEKLDDGPIITQYKLDLSGKLSDTKSMSFD